MHFAPWPRKYKIIEEVRMKVLHFKDFVSTAKPVIAEAKVRNSTKEFTAICDFVTDSLNDLSDALGKNGTLAALMKESGASKLDTEKDRDGKNIAQQIIQKTTDYKKSIEKLLVEAEFLVSQSDE